MKVCLRLPKKAVICIKVYFMLRSMIYMIIYNDYAVKEKD